MELWIPITLVAALLQNLRSGLQRHLKAAMGTTGATFVRFGFGMPFAVGLVFVLHFGFGFEFPKISARFLLWMLVGVLAQIGATFLLIRLFSFRNFAVGTACSRTEPTQFSLILKAWRPSLLVGMAGATASLGWFMAMTLQNAAVVKALAQVEMLFAFATSALIFREKIDRVEAMGCALILTGIVVMLTLKSL